MPLSRNNSSSIPTLKRRFFSIRTMVAFALAGAVLAFLFTRFDIDISSTWQSIRSSNPGYFVLAVLIHYTTFFFRGARWRLLLKNAQEGHSTPEPSTRYCSALILLGWFTNSVTWFRLGDAYRAHAYSEDTGGSFPRTIGTILAERVLDMALVFALLTVAILFLATTGVGAYWIFIVLAAIMSVGLTVVIVVMVMFRSRLLRFLPGPLESMYQRFHEGTIGSFGRLHLVTLLGLLGWMAEVGRLYFVSQALGIPLTVPLLIFVTLANAMLTLIPITPGGLGAVEWGITGLLMLAENIETETVAFSIVALDRSISWLSVIIVGAVVFLGREMIRRRYQREAVSRSPSTGDD